MEAQKEPNPNRPLPTDRSTVGGFLYGVKEPNHIPLGKVTLGSALEFISKYQSEPINYNAKKIAEEHSLPENTVSKYFHFNQVVSLLILIFASITTEHYKVNSKYIFKL